MINLLRWKIPGAVMMRIPNSYLPLVAAAIYDLSCRTLVSTLYCTGLCLDIVLALLIWLLSSILCLKTSVLPMTSSTPSLFYSETGLLQFVDGSYYFTADSKPFRAI